MESMFAMFRKVNAREHILGWYSTGPTIKECDMGIHEVLMRYCTNPLFVVVDVQPKELEIPTEAYMAVEEQRDDGSAAVRLFVHVPSEIGAVEAEEIGVEHLLRDVKDAAVSSLSTKLVDKVNSLKGLQSRLAEVKAYLAAVQRGTLPINNEVMYLLQDVFNLLPSLDGDAVAQAMACKTNDMMLGVYLGSLIKAIVAIHNLINNKISLSAAEAAEEAAKREKEKAAAAEKDKKPDAARDAADPSKMIE